MTLIVITGNLNVSRKSHQQRTRPGTEMYHVGPTECAPGEAETVNTPQQQRRPSVIGRLITRNSCSTRTSWSATSSVCGSSGDSPRGSFSDVETPCGPAREHWSEGNEGGPWWATALEQPAQSPAAADGSVVVSGDMMNAEQAAQAAHTLINSVASRSAKRGRISPSGGGETQENKLARLEREASTLPRPPLQGVSDACCPVPPFMHRAVLCGGASGLCNQPVTE